MVYGFSKRSWITLQVEFRAVVAIRPSAKLGTPPTPVAQIETSEPAFAGFVAVCGVPSWLIAATVPSARKKTLVKLGVRQIDHLDGTAVAEMPFVLTVTKLVGEVLLSVSGTTALICVAET